MNVTINENDQVTEIVCVLDKSGSMQLIASDSIGGYNTFLEEQKKLPGKAIFSMTQFDTDFNQVYNGEDIQDVPQLNENSYRPGGLTALYDAVGKTIHEVEKRHIAMSTEELPDKVLFIILTDGEENASMEYSEKHIFDLISEKRKGNWEFIFLAANQDAMKAGVGLGVANTNTMSYDATSRGITGTYTKMSNMSRKFRSSKGVSYDTLASEEEDDA